MKIPNNRAASASTDEQAYLGAAAFTDAGYKLIAVTYRHGLIEIRSHEYAIWLNTRRMASKQILISFYARVVEWQTPQT